MFHFIMPRHLMVRRVNDYNEPPNRVSMNQLTPFLGCVENVNFDHRNTSFNISLTPPCEYFQMNTNLASEMTWEGLNLLTVGTSDKVEITDELSSQNLPDNHFSQPKDIHFRQQMSPILKHSKTKLLHQPDFLTRSKDSFFSSSKNFGQTQMFTMSEHNSSISSKPVNHCLRKSDSENTNPYRLLGVKKNFLKRSGSLGYSRLHKLSPSKSRQNYHSKPHEEHPLSPVSKSKHNHHQHRHTTSENICDQHSIDTTSDRLVPSTENVSPSPKKILSPWKQSYFNINRTDVLKESQTSPKTNQDSSGHDSTRVSNFASNCHHGDTAKEKLTTYRTAAELNSATYVQYEDISLDAEQVSACDLSTKTFNSKKTTKDSHSDFAHDDKENIPITLKSLEESNKSKVRNYSHEESANNSVTSIHPLGESNLNKDVIVFSDSEVRPRHDQDVIVLSDCQGGSRLDEDVIILSDSQVRPRLDEDVTVLSDCQGGSRLDEDVVILSDSQIRPRLDEDVTMLEEDCTSHQRGHDAEISEHRTELGMSEAMDINAEVMTSSLPEMAQTHQSVDSQDSGSHSMFSSRHSDSGHEDDSRDVSPPLEEEINNPNELPASVEIDVVGDLPPTVTHGVSVDSGVADLTDQSLKDVTNDLSINRSRLSKSTISLDNSSLGASGSSFATPERPHQNKPMFASTPVSTLVMPGQYIASSFNPFMSSFATPYHFPMLFPSPLLDPHISRTLPLPMSSSHTSLDNFGLYHLNMLERARCSTAPCSPALSSNLTNTGPTYIHPISSVSSGIPKFSVDPNQHPQAFNLFTPYPFGVHVPAPNYVLPLLSSPALPLPQEYPLNLSLNTSHPVTSQNMSPPVRSQTAKAGPSECKKRRVTRKQKANISPRELAEIPSVSNVDVKMELNCNRPNSCRPETEQLVKGVVLANPPPGARPISFLVKTKPDGMDRKAARAAKRSSKENVCEETKQRNKPELFGDNEISELRVEFYACPERDRFCDEHLNFQVPKIPDIIDDQSELNEALLRLFLNSNLPPVPSALKHSVHALSQYPRMQHIFSLHSQGVDLDLLKFGAFGLAFENIQLVELGEQRFNEILDQMSYLGEDDMLHCLVQNEKTGAMCGHKAREIGKIRRHSKNHYPDKKWVCVFCRVQMCDMTDLERHTATHTELKPFKCPKCVNKFCQKVTLTQHMHKSHSEQLTKWDAKTSYICRQDGCSFGEGEELACIRHLKQHHSQTDYIRRKSQNKWPFNCVPPEVVSSIHE